MVRRAKQSLRWSSLDDLPQIEDDHTVRNLPYDRQIVRNEKVCDALSILEACKKVKNHPLHRHIERRSRLVAHYQLGVACKCPSDGHSLSLTPAKFSGIPIHIALSETHRVQQLNRTSSPCPSI